MYQTCPLGFLIITDISLISFLFIIPFQKCSALPSIDIFFPFLLQYIDI